MSNASDIEMWYVRCDTWDVIREMWYVRCDTWNVIREMWYVRCDTWDVIREMWYVRCDTWDVIREMTTRVLTLHAENILLLRRTFIKLLFISYIHCNYFKVLSCFSLTLIVISLTDYVFYCPSIACFRRVSLYPTTHSNVSFISVHALCVICRPALQKTRREKTNLKRVLLYLSPRSTLSAFDTLYTVKQLKLNKTKVSFL